MMDDKIQKTGKVVLTYGTFDLLHIGHVRLLERAKKMGDRLIVGVTSAEYDRMRGKLNVVQSCAERKEAVSQLGLADLVIEENYEGQKIQDIKKYSADIIVFGSDWTGKFDYLKEFCEVVYLTRTKGVSSSALRSAKNHVSLGIIGYGRIAHRMAEEAHAVSGLEIVSVFGRSKEKCDLFASKYELESYVSEEYDDFLKSVDAVYIALPHHLHVKYTRHALEKGKHVLCEKPMALHSQDAKILYDLAHNNECVLMEAFKTLWTPAFRKVISLAKSGTIGSIRSVDATFTKLIMDKNDRVYDPKQAGGSFPELGSYPLLAISCILGNEIQSWNFQSFVADGVDIYTRVNLRYDQAIASATTGIGVKREGDLVIAGTSGYIYVPAPWWKTDYFEIRRENTENNQKFYYPFEGDGLRYELAEFVRTIMGGVQTSFSCDISIFIAEMMDRFFTRQNMTVINQSQ